MERYLQNSAATTSVTFQEDGATVDPGTVTIGITREDGTVLVAPLTATAGTGAAARTFNLTTTHLASLDVLTLTWTSATKGVQITQVEVVGGFLFTLSEARALDALSSAASYPISTLIAGRTIAETALEEACGVSFVPRYFRTKVDGSGNTDVLLPARPLSITSVTVGATTASAGTALTANELTDLELYPDGRVYNVAGWTLGRRNVAIKGTKGYPSPPPRVGQAALTLAKTILVSGPVDERTTSFTTDGGTFALSTPGMRGAVFGIPEVDAVVSQYGVRDMVG